MRQHVVTRTDPHQRAEGESQERLEGKQVGTLPASKMPQLADEKYNLWNFYDLAPSGFDQSHFIDSWLYSQRALEEKGEKSIAGRESDIDDNFSNLFRVSHLNAAVPAQAKGSYGARTVSL